MNVFDHFVKHVLKVKCYVRYADDFVMFVESKEKLAEVYQKCEVFLTHKLALTIHPDKVFIQTVYKGLDFLGWAHFPDHRVLRTSTKRRIFRRMSENNITSYLGLLSHGNAYKLTKQLESNLLILI